MDRLEQAYKSDPEVKGLIDRRSNMLMGSPQAFYEMLRYMKVFDEVYTEEEMAVRNCGVKLLRQALRFNEESFGQLFVLALGRGKE